MSTRCQVRVVFRGYPVNYYHHCDGYFSGVGRDLRVMLMKSNSEPYAMMDLLADDREYEITFSNHSDIEYFYLLDFDRSEFWGAPVTGDWAKEGEDGYDMYKPWYNQVPPVDDEKRRSLLDPNGFNDNK